MKGFDTNNVKEVKAPRGFSPLILRYTNMREHGRAVFRLEDRLVYDEGTIRVVVPRGFETDFASVPRLLWIVFPPTGPYGPAAVVHDYLCKPDQQCSRFLADAIFRELMARLNVPWYVRLPVFYAVRAYGALGTVWKCTKGQCSRL